MQNPDREGCTGGHLEVLPGYQNIFRVDSAATRRPTRADRSRISARAQRERSPRQITPPWIDLRGRVTGTRQATRIGRCAAGDQSS
jgi:hypothetical protein